MEKREDRVNEIEREERVGGKERDKEREREEERERMLAE